MRRFFICTALLLCIGCGFLVGDNNPHNAIRRLVKSESLATELSTRIRSHSKDSVSFLILAGKQVFGDIVILYSGERFIDPDSNINLSEVFLKYYKRGSMDVGGHRLSLAYLAADTIPDMSYLFDEQALTDPFPEEQPLENDYCGNGTGVHDYDLFFIRDNQIVELDKKDILANSYPHEFEYYVGGTETFLRISSSTKTYELFDGVKESIGCYVQAGDTLKMIPAYDHYNSSLLQRPVIVSPNDAANDEQGLLIQIKGKESPCIKYYPSSDDDYFILLHQIHKSGIDSVMLSDEEFQKEE